MELHFVEKSVKKPTLIRAKISVWENVFITRKTKLIKTRIFERHI